MGHLRLEWLVPVRELCRMHPPGTGALVDRLVPLDGFHCDPGVELSPVPLPLCRHLSSPQPSHLDTACSLHHLSVQVSGYSIEALKAAEYKIARCKHGIIEEKEVTAPIFRDYAEKYLAYSEANKPLEVIPNRPGDH